VTEQSSQENKPVGDVAELIEWHTPDTPARPASRQHESAPQVEAADPPDSDVETDRAEDGPDGSIA
jgi:hypothetical protein